jgi:hypothetical protein
MHERREIGPGYGERITDDTIRFKWIGTVDVDEASTVMRWCTEVMEDVGRVFLLVDMTEADGVTTAGRRHMTNYAKERPISGFSLFGASFQLRVVVNLVINALNLLRKVPQPVSFADDEPGALAWIEDQRARLVAD